MEKKLKYDDFMSKRWNQLTKGEKFYYFFTDEDGYVFDVEVCTVKRFEVEDVPVEGTNLKDQVWVLTYNSKGYKRVRRSRMQETVHVLREDPNH